MHVFCDFDGTISEVDTTDFVLSRLAAPEWEAIEAQWVSGAITAAECMRAQVRLIQADYGALNAVLDEVKLTEGFGAFAAWVRAHNIPLTIISDGVDYFIHRILARHGLDDIELYSNKLAGEPGAWRLEQPWSLAGCAAATGVCKCGAAQISGFAEPGRRVVFVGDGRSDLCLSHKAELLFAKGWLAETARAANRAFTPFDTFHDVLGALVPLVVAPDRGASAVA